MIGFDDSRAVRELARRKVLAQVGNCPNCGAAPDVAMIDVSFGITRHYVPGLVSCSARCDERDPEAYLAAVKRMKETP